MPSLKVISTLKGQFLRTLAHAKGVILCASSAIVRGAW